jgi:hypothetical protein
MYPSKHWMIYSQSIDGIQVSSIEKKYFNVKNIEILSGCERKECVRN